MGKRLLNLREMGTEEEQNQNTDQNIYPAIDKPPGYDSISQPVTAPPQPSAPVEIPIQAAYAPGSEPIQTQPSATTNLLPQSTGKFEHDLFDCCGDIGSCCFSWCCPCIVASQIATKIGQSECCYCLGVWCFGGCAVACLRGDFRKFRNINGGCIADCITSIWCTPCALTQMHKETQNM